MAISRVIRRYGAVLAAAAMLFAACGSDSSEGAAAGPSAEEGSDLPTVVVTTNILGDVVNELVGDQAEVITIMPVGADPHDFQPSAQEVDQLLSADALIVNGADFEEGLLDVIESAREAGVPTFAATDAIETIEFGASGHDDHGHEDEDKEEDHDDHAHEDEDEEHADEDEHGDEDHDDHAHEDEDKEEDHDDHAHEDEDKEEDHDDHAHEDEDEEHADEEHDHEDEEHADEDEHGDEDHDDEEHDDHADEDEHDDHGHDHDGADPHFFTDPSRMADAADGIGAFLAAEIDGIDADALEASVSTYVDELTALDAEVEELVEAIPADRRILVTDHEVFGYFADRYGFEVVGTVIPSGSTADSASAGDLAELAELIEDEGVPAIFANTSSSTSLVETLSAEVGGVEIVELFSESLGEADSEGGTYIEMVRTNATRINAALS